MYEEVYYAERALRAGALGYVTKRESTGQIVEAIRQVRSGRVYASPELLARLAERLVGRAPPPPQGAMAILSDREIEVFQRLGQGHTTRRIATDLGVSIKTVQAYCARIKEKLSISSRDGADARGGQVGGERAAAGRAGTALRAICWRQWPRLVDAASCSGIPPVSLCLRGSH